MDNAQHQFESLTGERTINSASREWPGTGSVPFYTAVKDDAMRCFILFVILHVTIGCAADRQCELLEARLREQQDYVANLSNQLERAKADLSVANQESRALRQQLVARGKQPLEPEQADVLYRMAKLKIDQLQSSIIPVGASDQPLINLVLTPVDQFNEPIRLPGEVTIELSKQDASDALPVGEYHFEAAEVRKKWNAGWVSSGFVFQLPWPTKVSFAQFTGQQIKLKAIFKTVDGREFSATHRLKVRKTAKGAEQTENAIRQAAFGKKEAPPGRTDTSDRRTIDEFPILR